VARQVVWASRARSDARLALDYIHKDSPEAAKRLASALVTAARSLAELSERGRIVPELGDPAVRELLLSRFRVVYEVFPDRVAIVRVIHASRDLLAAWGRRATPE
jgi:plasmid stabilization system protein ParE